MMGHPGYCIGWNMLTQILAMQV